MSTAKDNYPNAHAMALGSLMGHGDSSLSGMLKNRPFRADEILYVGLQDLHGYQENYLKSMHVDYKVQTEEFVSDEEIKSFTDRFDHLLIHLDIDVLDADLFHSTYFANRELVGDGSKGGKMTMEKLSGVLEFITAHSDNRKWYALIMNVPRNKLGLEGEDSVDILDIKADPVMAGSFLLEEGILPGYHMNKGHWITVLLDGTVPMNTIELLLDVSFSLTGKKRSRKAAPLP